MRQFLTIVLIAALIWLGVKFSRYAQEKIGSPPPNAEAADAPAPGKLPGLPANLEPSLEAAKREGAEGLRQWLYQHRASIREPRLTDIDLDYVVLVGRSKPAEARQVLAVIRSQISTNSPVYKRFQQLDKAYQP